MVIIPIVQVQVRLKSRAMAELLTISEVSRRSGVAASALRFYEERGLIASERAGSGHRRYPRPVLRRIAFIVYAQRVGLTPGGDRGRAAHAADRPRAESPRLGPAVHHVDGAHRRADRRARAPPRGPDGVHRLRLPLAVSRCPLANPGDRAAAGRTRATRLALAGQVACRSGRATAASSSPSAPLTSTRCRPQPAVGVAFRCRAPSMGSSLSTCVPLMCSQRPR